VTATQKSKRVTSDYESDDGMQEEEEQLHNLDFLTKNGASYSSLGNAIETTVRVREVVEVPSTNKNDESTLTYDIYDVFVDQGRPAEADVGVVNESMDIPSPPHSNDSSPPSSPFPENINTSRRQSAPETIKRLAAVLHMDIDLDSEGFDDEEDEDDAHGTIDFDRASASSDGDILAGSSITASEIAENQLITGWNELERLETSVEGESITIRLKVREGDEPDDDFEPDDSIQLDPQSYKDLADLLRRAELSHKLSRQVIEKQR